MNDQLDVLITAGRVFCSETGLDGPGAVGIRHGRIVASGADLNLPARQVLDYPDALLLPGLVDLHAHPARDGSRYGVDPDLHFLPRGVTTCLSQGDAGALNWPAYRDEVIHGSRTRVRLALHLSKYGESAGSHCFERLEHADIDACVDTIAGDVDDEIWGIAFNTTVPVELGIDPRAIMQRGLAAANASGKPILYGHSQRRAFPLDEQLPLLRAGDVVTYTFSPREDNILRDGKIRDAVWEARSRGVLFDTGHGMAAFSLDIAEAAIADGFLPDTVSTDQYNWHVGRTPTHDLPRTISKLIACGMPETEAFARATARPAALLGLAGDVGTLAPGASADIAVLEFNDDGQLADLSGTERRGGCWEPLLTIRAGEIIEPTS